MFIRVSKQCERTATCNDACKAQFSFFCIFSLIFITETRMFRREGEERIFFTTFLAADNKDLCV